MNSIVSINFNSNSNPFKTFTTRYYAVFTGDFLLIHLIMKTVKKYSENWTPYIDSYIRDNESDHDVVIDH